MYAIDGGSGKWAGRESPGIPASAPRRLPRAPGAAPGVAPGVGALGAGVEVQPAVLAGHLGGGLLRREEGVARIRAAGPRAQAPPQRGQRAGSVAGAGPGGGKRTGGWPSRSSPARCHHPGGRRSFFAGFTGRSRRRGPRRGPRWSRGLGRDRPPGRARPSSGPLASATGPTSGRRPVSTFRIEVTPWARIPQGTMSWKA